MFQFRLHFRILLLQLSNLIILYLHLLNSLIIFRMCLRSLNTVLLLFTLQLSNSPPQLLVLSLVPQHLVLNLLQLVDHIHDLFVHIVLIILSLLQLLSMLSTLSQLLVYIILQSLPLLLQHPDLLTNVLCLFSKLIFVSLSLLFFTYLFILLLPHYLFLFRRLLHYLLQPLNLFDLLRYGNHL
jgi:hypothetical protein